MQRKWSGRGSILIPCRLALLDAFLATVPAYQTHWHTEAIFEQLAGGRFMDVGLTVQLRYAVPRANLVMREASEQERLSIEIKPAIGDDFPAILRQMHRSGAKYLLTESYTGTSADLLGVRQMFATSGRVIALLSEVQDQLEGENHG